MNEHESNIKLIQEFSNKHELIFKKEGEVGFGRPCVGLLAENGGYVDLNPYNRETFELIFQESDRISYTPPGVPDAYHKHECLCVLAHDEDYKTAIDQLAIWVKHLDGMGVELKRYATNATGIQAMISGVFGYAFVKKVENVKPVTE